VVGVVDARAKGGRRAGEEPDADIVAVRRAGAATTPAAGENGSAEARKQRHMLTEGCAVRDVRVEDEEQKAVDQRVGERREDDVRARPVGDAGAARKPIWTAASSNAVIAPKSIEYAVCAGARAGVATAATTSNSAAGRMIHGNAFSRPSQDRYIGGHERRDDHSQAERAAHN